MVWYNNPDMVVAIADSRREHARERRSGLRLVRKDGVDGR